MSAEKKYPGPKSVANRLQELVAWMRENKPTCKRITASRDDMIGLRKARPRNLSAAGFVRDGDRFSYAEFEIADPPGSRGEERT